MPPDTSDAGPVGVAAQSLPAELLAKYPSARHVPLFKTGHRPLQEGIQAGIRTTHAN